MITFSHSGDPKSPYIVRPEIRYVGDPRICHPKFNRSTIDQFWHKLTAAGFKIGQLIRHGTIVKDVGGSLSRVEPASIVADLANKIGYFRNRYGPLACLFYIDSNVRDNYTVDMRQMWELRNYFPADQVLISFEHVNPPNDGVWHGWSEQDVRGLFAGFCDPRGGLAPCATGFDLINPWDVQALTVEQRAAYAGKLKDGSIPLAFGWFDHWFNGAVAEMRRATGV